MSQSYHIYPSTTNRDIRSVEARAELPAIARQRNLRALLDSGLGHPPDFVATRLCTQGRACVEISQQLDVRVDFAARTNRTVPHLPAAPMAMARVGRSRLVRPNGAMAPQGGDPGDADVAMSPTSRVSRVRSTALRDLARQ